MTAADYDPLALPAAYFEGLPTGVPTGVPNNLPSRPEAVEDMSAGADLTGVAGSAISQLAPRANRVEGVPDLTVEGPCAQQHTPAGGTRQ